MKEKTTELIQKFEREICISSTDTQINWLLYARVTGNPAVGTPHVLSGIRFVSGPKEEGNVQVMQDLRASNACSVESWAQMKTIDDIVKKDPPGFWLTKTSWTKDRREVAGPAVAELFPLNL